MEEGGRLVRRKRLPVLVKRNGGEPSSAAALLSNVQTPTLSGREVAGSGLTERFPERVLSTSDPFVDLKMRRISEARAADMSETLHHSKHVAPVPY